MIINHSSYRNYLVLVLVIFKAYLVNLNIGWTCNCMYPYCIMWDTLRRLKVNGSKLSKILDVLIESIVNMRKSFEYLNFQKTW